MRNAAVCKALLKACGSDGCVGAERSGAGEDPQHRRDAAAVGVAARRRVLSPLHLYHTVRLLSLGLSVETLNKKNSIVQNSIWSF